MTYFIKSHYNKFRVLSENGENMGTYLNIKEAQDRISNLKSISFVKLYKEAKEQQIDFTYSATLRFLRKEYPNKVNEFLQKFKKIFDQACINPDLNFGNSDSSQELEKICLMQTIKKMDNLNGDT